ncbi:hypothetical protein PFISCL1PPCAC_26901, partial [Pristionchus fissidentatus]
QFALVGGGVLIVVLIFYFALVRRENRPMTLLAASGVYGILCIANYDVKWSWCGETSIIQRATSTISALGHTISKFYVILNRYSVLSMSFGTDNWTTRTIVILLIAQFLIPVIVASPLVFARPTGVGFAYGPGFLINIVQVVSAVVYGTYVITGLVLSILSMRKLRALLNNASERRKNSVIRQEVMITAYSTCLFFAHSLKCFQQIAFAAFQNNPTIYEINMILYPYFNDFAVFSSPVLILIISKKLRMMLLSFFRPTFKHTATVAPFS